MTLKSIRSCGRRWGRPGAQGFTLIEVLIGMVLLALLAIGGGAFLLYSRTLVDIQRNKRAAAEAATGRMEELRASGYSLTRPLTYSYAVVYLRRTGNTWTQSASDPGETLSINGKTMPMITTVQFVDVDGGSVSYDATLFDVQVGYRVGAGDRVRLTTLNSP